MEMKHDASKTRARSAWSERYWAQTVQKAPRRPMACFVCPTHNANYYYLLYVEPLEVQYVRYDMCDYCIPQKRNTFNLTATRWPSVEFLEWEEIKVGRANTTGEDISYREQCRKNVFFEAKYFR